MGDALYDTVIEKYRRNVRIYAPVGAHKDLLPYLVRRLLENGANSSFVHKLVDPRVPVETLIQHPVTQLPSSRRWPTTVPLPQAIFGAGRKNSQGINMNIQNQWNELELAYKPHLTRQWQAAPIVNGEKLSCPAPRSALPVLTWRGWSAGPVRVRRAGRLGPRRVAGGLAALERHPGGRARRHPRTSRRPAGSPAGELMALCTLEAGKSLDGIDEIREAVDFCRYYAQQARQRLVREELRGPTGERNELFYPGRGHLRLRQPVELPGDLPRPDQRCAGGRQHRCWPKSPSRPA